MSKAKLSEEERRKRRQEGARKAAATRKARAAERWAYFNERGVYEASRDRHVERLASLGVVIGEPEGTPSVYWSQSHGRAVMIVATFRVSINRCTVILRRGLHPASEAHALEAALRVHGSLRFGNWRGWAKGIDETGSECYSADLIRDVPLDIDDVERIANPYRRPAGALLDVDPVEAVLEAMMGEV